MPVDRFFHPRAGFSVKVTGLTDLQFRVWWTYVLAADDFGVMRRTAIALQSANAALATRPQRLIQQAIDTLVTVGLLAAFEHQGEPFVCTRTWQDFQKIRYPRETLLPLPPASILEQCSPDTAELFRKHSGNVSGEFPSLPRAGARETARGKRLEANGERQTAGGQRLAATGLEEGSGEKPRNGETSGFAAFWDVYPRQARRDDALRAWTALQPSAELVAQIVAAVVQQRTWPQWTREAGRFIPAPAKWLEARGWDDRPPEALPAAVSDLARQNRANAEAAKQMVRGRTS